MSDVAPAVHDGLEEADREYAECHRAHPFQTPPDFVARLRSLLAVMLIIVVGGACRAAPALSTDILALERAAAER